MPLDVQPQPEHRTRRLSGSAGGGGSSGSVRLTTNNPFPPVPSVLVTAWARVCGRQPHWLLDSLTPSRARKMEDLEHLSGGRLCGTGRTSAGTHTRTSPGVQGGPPPGPPSMCFPFLCLGHRVLGCSPIRGLARQHEACSQREPWSGRPVAPPWQECPAWRPGAPGSRAGEGGSCTVRDLGKSRMAT